MEFRKDFQDAPGIRHKQMIPLMLLVFLVGSREMNLPLVLFDFFKLLVFVIGISRAENFRLGVQNHFPVVSVSLPFGSQFIIRT